MSPAPGVDMYDLAETPRGATGADRPIGPRERAMWLLIRKALIIAANAIGEYLDCRPVRVADDEAGRR
jgi:hypothetical protein